MLRRILATLAILAAPHAFAATQGGPIPVPLPLFPGNNWWNTDVSAAPLDANSANFITFINNGAPRHVHPDWGGDNYDGTTYGFPYIIVDGTQPLKTVTFATPEESDGVDHAT